MRRRAGSWGYCKLTDRLSRQLVNDPGQQALMMNPVEKAGQVKINHRLIAVLQVSGCFSDGGVSPALWAEPVTAGMKGRFEDRLQDLERRLLNHPVHDVRNAQPPLPASGHAVLGRSTSPQLIMTTHHQYAPHACRSTLGAARTPLSMAGC